VRERACGKCEHSTASGGGVPVRIHESCTDIASKEKLEADTIMVCISTSTLITNQSLYASAFRER
jgi:hypothetical protein